MTGLGPAPADGPALATNDEAPWHDPSMAAPERIKMAEGRPARAATDVGDGAAGLRAVRL